MADARRRARPLWIWLLGLIVLLVALWIVVDQVLETDDPGAPSAAPAAEAAPDGDMPGRATGPVTLETPIEALLPLGDTHPGTRVRVDGRVVRTRPHGAWVLTDRGALVFLLAAGDDATLDAGESITATGRVRRDDADIMGAPPAIDDAEYVQPGARVDDHYVETTADQIRRRRPTRTRDERAGGGTGTPTTNRAARAAGPGTDAVTYRHGTSARRPGCPSQRPKGLCPAPPM